MEAVRTRTQEKKGDGMKKTDMRPSNQIVESNLDLIRVVFCVWCIWLLLATTEKCHTFLCLTVDPFYTQTHPPSRPPAIPLSISKIVVICNINVTAKLKMKNIGLYWKILFIHTFILIKTSNVIFCCYRLKCITLTIG